ncbi:MAG: putative NEDD8-conjugating enzyme UBC12 [Streblomastix strix]|uniref:Putative NEDD8-conjugating enzyme UBC12 n=1 Tax=Streblomastix strix TaxID=222440 RepID=A0A5J4WG96_9EUKA|nr:MAG: putative NEDD8-conjugating enzyme UBC12 [Streblomastix strix]
MIDLKKRAKERKDMPQEQKSALSPRCSHLSKDLQDLELPKNVKMRFPKQGDIREIEFLVTPEDGLWKDGNFLFNVQYTPEYRNACPKIKCLTNTYHPQFLKDEVCLSIKRTAKTEIDGGWTPIRGTIDIIQSFLLVLMNPDGTDALNPDVANMMLKDYDQFKKNVEASFRGEIVDGVKYEKQPIHYDFPENVKKE